MHSLMITIDNNYSCMNQATAEAVLVQAALVLAAWPHLRLYFIGHL